MTYGSASIVWLAVIGAQLIQLRTHAIIASKRFSVMPLLLSVAAWALVIGWWYIHCVIMWPPATRFRLAVTP